MTITPDDVIGGVDRDEFVVHYQPVVRLSDGAIVGNEALVRWQRPGHGLLMPDAFLPQAEACDAIRHVDDAVMRCALRDFASGRLDGDEVSVNCSASSVDAGLPGRVADALTATGMTAGCLVVEVTEQVTLRSTPVTDAAIAELCAMGVRVAMDDFGAGASRLSTLIDIPYARLKLDKGLVGQLVGHHAPRARLVVNAINELAAGMGVAVVGEGVETCAHVQALWDEDVPLAQGYLYGRPAPVGAVSPRNICAMA